ncbi:hypothetical protein K450DRAFT_175923 [Umbelopsis ramanniana AG]|uniref:Phosphotransferase n=1 Tax=Umbelopsis ramanniana AG TaxID=1314678 RepID=A0AAD5E793_UMBRA|nr:uncharacterized protein K450DRAFT_175923 [Umbelopsis ramanniana AG]KAI8578721.1 hypothetical protein K450DRAFT_175923 [Umbelopsis ramanniana AG]
MLDQLRSTFALSKDKLAPIVDGFNAETKHGLKTPSKGLATMIPSFVTALPTGNETGTYMALDLGGTNLRVSAVRLLGNGQVEVLEVKKVATNELKNGPCDPFFDWMAEAVKELVTVKAKHLFKPAQVNGTETLSLGVCWSFPVDQTSFSQGTMLRMGKGFILDGYEGQDLAGLFHQAFERKHINVRVTALINDTVGTLVAAAYANPHTRIGFIFATGVNAAYPEKLSNIDKLGSDEIKKYGGDNPDAEMLINTEIDIFGNESYLPLTKYDKELDANHSQPGFQPYEKMLSGAYLGEITRLIAVDFIREGHLFGGAIPKGWDTPWSFATAQMGTLERDTHPDRQTSIELLTKAFEFQQAPSVEDITTLTEICKIVATRAASLVAVAIASMIEQQELHTGNDKDIIIGMNGSTYEFYPYMEERIHRSLKEWFGTEVSDRIRFEIARDGGSIGGALIAMLCENS